MNIDSLQYIASLTDTLIARGRETIVILGSDIDDPDGPTICFINSAAEKLIGRSASEVIGQHLAKISDPETLPLIIGQLHDTIRSKEPYDAVLRVPSADGRNYWIDVSTTPILNADGTIRHFVRIGRDITTRKLAEQQRELTQLLLASLFGVVDDPLLITGAQGQIVMANAAFGRRLGWGILDTIGMNLSELVQTGEQGDWRPLLFETDNQLREIEAVLKHRDGKAFSGRLITKIVREPNGGAYHIFKLKIGEEYTASPEAIAAKPESGAIRIDPSNRTVVAGKLQLIGLELIKQRLGDRWPAMAERTFALAERVIQKYMRQGDVLRRSSEDGFLVLFGNLTEAEAQFKAEAIGNEIREQLIGEVPEAAEARVASFAAAVRIDEDEAENEESIVEALGRRLEAERNRVEERSRSRAKNALKEGAAHFRRLANERRQPTPILLARAPGDLIEPIKTLESLGQTPFTLEMEVFLLTGACERILSDISQRTADLIMIPVRVETLSQPRDLEKWLAVARTLGDAGRQKAVAEVIGISADIAHIRMRDITMRLSTLFRSVSYELPTTDPAFAQALPDATKLATISYHRFIGPDGTPPPRTARLLKTLSTRSCRLIVKDTPADQADRLTSVGVNLMEVSAGAGGI